MKFRKWEIALILGLIVTVTSAATLVKEESDLSDKLIRLHVVANSDSSEDQNLKLKVRDKIISDVSRLLQGINDRTQAAAVIDANMQSLLADSTAVIEEAGFNYDITGKITVEEFPTRDYDSFSLPAGDYLSLRVIIGAGQGHNWWCVVYPPLCMTGATKDSDSMKVLSQEDMKLMTQQTPRYAIKFKSIELLHELMSIFRRSV